MTLLQKLQDATEGSRELDWRIAWQFGHPSMAYARDDFFPPFVVGSFADNDVPYYTTNLQDAVSLALEMGATSIKLQWRQGELAKAMMGFPWDDGVPFSEAGSTLELAASGTIIKAHESKEAEAA